MATFQQVGLHLDPGRLRVLIEAGQAATTQRELEDVLERLLAPARQLTGAQHAAIKVIDDHAVDVEPDVTTQTAGRATQRGGSIDVAILIDEAAWGSLWLADKEHGEFERVDEETAIVLARWAAIAVSNGRAYRPIEQRRADLERSVRALEALFNRARVTHGLNVATTIELEHGVRRRGRRRARGRGGDRHSRRWSRI